MSCASLPETLAKSELIGCEAGAFTGAVRRRCGLVEQACSGTLLLDEIAELRSALQPKLLGVLEDRAVRRLAGGAEIPVDVRFIAATNTSLESAVAAGRFRADPYYRLPGADTGPAGSITGAARRLGVRRQSLSERCERLGINPEAPIID